jgi:signal transduction histidine kinase
MLLLAAYFRDLTEEKSTSAIFYKLGKRAVNVEGYINRYLFDTIDLPSLLDRAAKDLRIDYSIYKNDKLFYSSNSLYYDIGLLSERLSPEVYRQLNYQGKKEIVVTERIETYSFNSYFLLGSIGSDEYIFEVNDLFNSILIPFSDIELDIFLFGTYSLAVILIVIISTLIANQISAPIRKLTLATKSVASGDLNIEVAEDQKGEVGDLVIGFNMMVRELKKGQAEIAEMERESAWKEMAKQVAHEIKNPLTPMKLSVQQLIAARKDKSERFDSIFDKVTKTIVAQIEALKNIASEFSNFARMPGLKTEIIDLTKVCSEAIDLFSQEAVKISFDSEPETASVEADRDQLKRTFINIIRNSIQAGSDIISVKLNERDDYFQIRIIDNGTGIDKKYIDKVFNDNFTTKSSGMGLGLAMAKRFIEQISGKIIVEETSEKGTIVLIELLRTNE